MMLDISCDWNFVWNTIESVLRTQKRVYVITLCVKKNKDCLYFDYCIFLISFVSSMNLVFACLSISICICVFYIYFSQLTLASSIVSGAVCVCMYVCLSVTRSHSICFAIVCLVTVSRRRMLRVRFRVGIISML